MSVRDRKVIGVLAVVAVIAAAWLLVIQPKRNELANVKRQVTSEQGQLASAQSQVAAGQAARAQFPSNYASMVKLGEAVPTDDNVGSLIYQLQSAATTTGVDFRSLALSSQGGGSGGSSQATLPPGVTVGSAGFPSEPFSFTFRGSFFHLADFFGRLERFVAATKRGLQVRGRLLTVDSITLGPGAGGFPQIDATVAATAYLLPPSQGLAAGASPTGPGGLATAASGSPGAASGAAPSASGAATPPVAAIAGGQP
jgi:hypothetical protein